MERGGPATGIEAELHYEEMRRRADVPGLANLPLGQRAGGHSLALPMSTRVVSAGASPAVIGEKTLVSSDLLNFSSVKDAELLSAG